MLSWCRYCLSTLPMPNYWRMGSGMGDCTMAATNVSNFQLLADCLYSPAGCFKYLVRLATEVTGQLNLKAAFSNLKRFKNTFDCQNFTA